MTACLDDMFGPPVAPNPQPENAVRGRSSRSKWTPSRAQARRVQRWTARATSARTLCSQSRLLATRQPVADLFDGIIIFKSTGRRGGRQPVNWQSVLRIVTSPSNVSAATMASIAFGDLVADISIRRTRVRVACGLDTILRGKVNSVLARVSAIRPSDTPVVIGQLWKFDDTEVRWRTLKR